MRIDELHIKTFRSIKELRFEVQPLQALIGENNSGKSNILDALELFLSGSLKAVTKRSFNDLTAPIEMSVTFSDLTDRERGRFRGYVRGDQLTLTLTIGWDDDEGKPTGGDYHGMLCEPRAEHLKESKLDDWSTADLQRFVTEYGLPDYFLAASGRPNKTSYKAALPRYLQETPDIEMEPPEQALPQTLGWKNVLKGNLPEYFLLPPVRDFADEEKLTGTTSLGRLVSELTTRIIENDPKMAEVQQHIRNAQQLLNPPDGPEDHRPAELPAFEQTLTDLLKESMPAVSRVTIQVILQEVKEVLQSGVRILIDDGILTPVTMKGHGLQRAMIFAILRAYAERLKSEVEPEERPEAAAGQPVRRRTLVIAVEEPELYLHPQAQRTLLRVMRAISGEDQVIFCTHSPYFVDLTDHTGVAIASKKDLATGTKVCQHTSDIFPEDAERKQFKMLAECDPSRSELFFARRVILLEGACDKVAVQSVADHLGLQARFDEQSVSLVACEAKDNMPFFMRILNAFAIPYIAVHDVDDPANTKNVELNAAITQTVDSAVGRVIQFTPDLEHEAGYTQGHFKPWTACQFFANPANINDRMKVFVRSLLA